MDAFFGAHPDMGGRLVFALLAVVLALVAYIWRTRVSDDSNSKNRIETSFNAAIVRLDTTISKLDTTIKSLETRAFNEVTKLGKEHAALDKRVEAIISICRERSRHCPMFASGEGFSHFHSRMAASVTDVEGLSHQHQRDQDDTLSDGSD